MANLTKEPLTVIYALDDTTVGARVISARQIGKKAADWAWLDGDSVRVAPGQLVRRVLPAGMALHIASFNCTGRDIRSPEWPLRSLTISGTSGDFTYDRLSVNSAITRRLSGFAVIEYR